MFNLDQAIEEWRRQMAAGGIKASPILDELENHVREDIERQMQAGASGENAFAIAVKKIGPASALSKEFRKSKIEAILEKLMIAFAVLWVAFGLFLSIVTVIFCYLTLGERLIGVIAIGLLFVTACGWPAIVPVLPVIQNKRKRQAIEVACLLGGFGLCTLFVQIVVPHFDSGPDRILPPVGFFGLFPIAVGLCLASGLEQAVRRAARRITA